MLGGCGFHITRAEVSSAVLIAWGEVGVPWRKLFHTASLYIEA